MRGRKQVKESTGRMRKHRYSTEFKVTAVKLASAPDIEVQAVAEALGIHPFMLSRWKKETCNGATDIEDVKLFLKRNTFNRVPRKPTRNTPAATFAVPTASNSSNKPTSSSPTRRSHSSVSTLCSL